MKSEATKPQLFALTQIVSGGCITFNPSLRMQGTGPEWDIPLKTMEALIRKGWIRCIEPHAPNWLWVISESGKGVVTPYVEARRANELKQCKDFEDSLSPTEPEREEKE